MMLTRLVAFSTLSVLLSAQTLDSLPQCGQLCVHNMLNKATELGCAENDKVCLCKNIDFAYGIRDCSHEVCGPEQAIPVVAYGMSYCNSVSNNTPPLNNNPPVQSSTTMLMPGNHTMTGASSSSTLAPSMPTSVNSAISTSTIISLITSGSEVQTSTVGFKTIYSSDSAPLPSSTSDSMDKPSSSHPSSPSSSEEPSTSTSSAGGSKQTVYAGFAAVAGLAALIL